MTHEALVHTHKDAIKKIASSHGAHQIKLFGSVAQGKSNTNSDIDLLVSMNPGYSLLNIIAIKQDLEDLLGQNIDVVTESAISPYIRDAILKEAISL
jgi:predicted nucleotidyltransferase